CPLFLSPRPPASPPFPYTTLFRSREGVAASAAQGIRAPVPVHDHGAIAIGLVVVDHRGAREHLTAGIAGEEGRGAVRAVHKHGRSEEHTSELQSRENLVCRLLPEK